MAADLPTKPGEGLPGSAFPGTDRDAPAESDSLPLTTPDETVPDVGEPILQFGNGNQQVAARLRESEVRFQSLAHEMMCSLVNAQEVMANVRQIPSAVFRSIADSAPVLIWMSGTDKKCVYFNQPWLEFTGRTMEQELGDGWAEGVHPDDHARCLEVYVTQFDAREPFEMEYRLRRHDGEYRWVLDRGQPQFTPAGEFEGYVGSAIDITDFKRADKALQASEKRYRALFEKANDAIFLETEDDDIIAVNQRACDLLGYSREELLAMKVPDLQAPEVRGIPGTVIKGELGRHQDNPFEGLDLHRDGRRIPVEITDAVIQENGKRLVLSIVRDVTERKQAEEALCKALLEVRRLKDQLQAENVYLREEIRGAHSVGEIIGQGPAIKQVLTQVEQVAGTDSTVLLLGETGTGKELLATALHNLSPRRARAMVKVNCAALPATLVESELFGREKGAYTGALSKQVGRFELAHGSTIFLDEVGDLPAEVQVKLLRVLQEGTLEHLGSPKPIAVNVRVIAASNRDLAQAVREGRFREDLFYRLNVFPITVPPLRERREDIPLLVWAFVEEFTQTLGKTIRAIAKESMEALQAYAWPGNVRELRNLIERAMITSTGPTLRVSVPAIAESITAKSMAMEDVEREHILHVLELTRWRIRGKNGAAEMLCLKPTTLESRMAKLGIQRPGQFSDIS
jgi:PAS domain S-box-containing protein